MQILLVMARCVRPDIEVARVTIAALHDMAYLYPDSRPLLEAEQANANAQHIAQTALRLLGKRETYIPCTNDLQKCRDWATMKPVNSANT